jgi:hypothetical protein
VRLGGIRTREDPTRPRNQNPHSQRTLPYAHIFPVFTPSDAPSLVDGGEALQSVKHRDGSGLAFTSIAFPSPKPRNDPGRPCQRFEWVWVSLFSGLALKGGLQVSQDFDFLLVKGIGGWTRRFTRSCEGQLHRPDCCRCGEHHEFFQAPRLPDQAGLKVQPLSLEGAEHLLDLPSLAVPVDALPGLFKGRHRMGGQEPPVNGGFGTHHRVGTLDHLNDVEDPAFRSLRIRAMSGNFMDLFRILRWVETMMQRIKGVLFQNCVWIR